MYTSHSYEVYQTLDSRTKFKIQGRGGQKSVSTIRSSLYTLTKDLSSGIQL